MGHSEAMQRRLVEERLTKARNGSVEACYELGVDYSVGRHGVDVDLIEAHKWFNLAALSGYADEIAEAQRQARAWLAGAMPLAA
jgi:uncharacterized protein